MSKEPNLTISILVDNSAAEVYKAINNARDWWQGEFTGRTDVLNEEFEYRVEGVHFSKQKVSELTPNKRVVWLSTDSNLCFVEIKDEWTGTRIHFDISTENGKSKLTFTHEGLVPSFQCYEACSGAWGMLIAKSLFSYITTGKGVKLF